MSERFQPREGWLSVGLLLLLQLSVAWSLQSANWAPGLELLNSVVLVAMPIGFLLAKSRLPGSIAHLLAIMIGSLWVTWLSFELVPEIDGSVNQFIEISVRIVTWIRAALDGSVNADNTIFVLEMLGIFWIVGYTGALSMYRTHNIWGVLLPAGTIILINTYYAQQGLSLILVAFLVSAFLLIVRTFLYEQEQEWQAHHITYNPDVGYDFLRDGAIFAITVIILAWVVPAAVERGQFNPFLARMGGPLGAVQQNWNRLFAALNYRGTATGSWFGRSMTFQGPLRLSDELVMEVQADGGRYWRAVVFDRYSSAGWSATNGRVVELEGETPSVPGLAEPGAELRTPVVQTFTMFNPAGTLLFAAAQPIQVNLPSSILIAGPASRVENATETAMSQLYAQRPLYRGAVYKVTSAVSEADMKTLRAAGTNYPDYILQEYTQVPDTLPTRVRDLAIQLTESAETPFDKARALEQYLRTFPYDETITGPKPGQDGVDYFLFEQRSGYCDYYASSMAVMLRSLGIPARLAQGYSQGEQEPSSGAYLVRQRDAHTWVEVYFPGYGWIEFEPTAAEPQIARAEVPKNEETASAVPTPAGPADTPLDDLERLRRQEEERTRANAGGLTNLPLYLPSFDSRMLLIPLGLLVVAGIATVVSKNALQRRWEGLPLIERIFDQIAVLTIVLGIHQRPTQTPAEYAEEVGTQVPPARSAMQRLTTLFSRSRFGQAGLSPDEEQEADSLWRSIRLLFVKHLGNRWRRQR
jgi:transglutaminase-like putative cysteine protease